MVDGGLGGRDAGRIDQRRHRGEAEAVAAAVLVDADHDVAAGGIEAHERVDRVRIGVALEDAAEVERVALVGIEILDRVAALGQREEDVPVRPGAADQGVWPGAADQHVVAGAAVQEVVAEAAVEHVVARQAEQLVVAAAARDRVVDHPAVIADQDVVVVVAATRAGAGQIGVDHRRVALVAVGIRDREGEVAQPLRLGVSWMLCSTST